MTENLTNDEQKELIDALYELQSVRERVSELNDFLDPDEPNDTEPAIFPGEDELVDSCSVFIDQNTKDRIVLSPLPADQDDFKSANLWFSNPEGLILPTELANSEFKPQEVVYFIGKTALPGLYLPQDSEIITIEPKIIVEKIKVPDSILPLPVYEYDPREIPPNIEMVYTPDDKAYTLATALFDKQLKAGVLGVKHHGFVASSTGATIYSLEILEKLPNEEDLRLSQFDREMRVKLTFPTEIDLSMMPWGELEQNVRADTFLFKVFRAGVIVEVYTGDRFLRGIPTNQTRTYLQDLLNVI
jgi:hypothetical protein